MEKFKLVYIFLSLTDSHLMFIYQSGFLILLDVQNISHLGFGFFFRQLIIR